MATGEDGSLRPRQTVAMDHWELEARLELTDLVNRYNIYGDSGEFEKMIKLFADDGVLEIAGERAYTGRAEILAFVSGVGDSVSATAKLEPGPMPGYIRHHNTTKIVDFDDRDHATGRVYFFVVTDRGPDHWGRYRDRYVLDRNRAWKFAHRVARTDGRAPGSWAEEQNFG
jgi:hypothetical protein